MVIKGFLCSHGENLKRNLADISRLSVIHRGGLPINKSFISFASDVKEAIHSGKGKYTVFLNVVLLYIESMHVHK